MKNVTSCELRVTSASPSVAILKGGYYRVHPNSEGGTSKKLKGMSCG